MESKKIVELRKRIERHQKTVEKHTATAAQILGTDPASKASRKYYQGIARRATEEKTELEQELAGLDA